MRISDWSSDVCSSDLLRMVSRHICACRSAPSTNPLIAAVIPMIVAAARMISVVVRLAELSARVRRPKMLDGAIVGDVRDRKSVVKGKRVSVRVDLGGRRILKKNKNQSKSTNKG